LCNSLGTRQSQPTTDLPPPPCLPPLPPPPPSPSTLTGWKSGMIWETRHSPAYYEPGDLSPDIHRKLAAAHAQVGDWGGWRVEGV
jgi:hypothetical protein